MEKLKLLDFWAPWCKYCQMMTGTIDELIKKYGDKIELVSINIDQDRDNSEKYRVMSVPTYVIIDTNNNILDRISGYHTREAMDNFISNCLR